MRTAVCVICFKPHDAWINFLATFTEYEVFVIIDDNSHDYVSSNDKIKFVQISHEDCMNNGFLGINFLFHNPTGWEKALYYFSSVMKDHDRVWFMEEDIFFNSEKTLLDIDAAYPTSDLLTAPCEENKDGNKSTWLWEKITIAFEPPYHHGMVCISRISKALLEAIRTYATENKTLFFLEALFPSICHNKSLIHDSPPQLGTVLWKMDYTLDLFTKDKVYHPVKKMEDHDAIRKRLSMGGGGKGRTRRRRYRIKKLKGRYKLKSRARTRHH